jgi:hypothetical protein
MEDSSSERVGRVMQKQIYYVISLIISIEAKFKGNAHIPIKLFSTDTSRPNRNLIRPIKHMNPMKWMLNHTS